MIAEYNNWIINKFVFFFSFCNTVNNNQNAIETCKPDEKCESVSSNSDDEINDNESGEKNELSKIMFRIFQYFQ